ncbi:AI-2E family transporter [Methanoregula sp.]|uniref:AI-2E family transporter n=1 Tax=Methanoregula sp. TaxID=2052170 RepID=UPI0023721B83|nr:AI-2E family transporter [Methanoregula sp.]MDD1685863.1 AI-2E family transporter [Methanoregula sp.]
MNTSEPYRIERALLIIALVFIIVLAVKETTYIISLILMAIILTMLTLPAVNWLKSKGLSDFLAVIVVTITACLVILVIVFLAVMSFHSLAMDIPLYQKELNTRLADISGILFSLGLSSSATSFPSIDIGDLMNFAVSGVRSFAEGIMYLFFVAVTTFFLLLETPKIISRIERSYGKDTNAVEKFGRMTGYVIDFIVVRTETNAIHGFLFGGFLGIMGVHGAILWGVLTFLLGYIPYFGLILAAIPAIFFAWLQFGIPGALAVIAAVCVLNIIVENPVYSFLAAKKFEMPALIVILSVIIWGWLLGIVGMFFAIPLTLFLLLIFESCEELRWINAMMGVSHLFETGKEHKSDTKPIP